MRARYRLETAHERSTCRAVCWLGHARRKAAGVRIGSKERIATLNDEMSRLDGLKARMETSPVVRKNSILSSGVASSCSYGMISAC
jgi:hypothetical protein